MGKTFEGDFGASGIQLSVPIRRIDFSGYGASIFSEWSKPNQIPLSFPADFKMPGDKVP